MKADVYFLQEIFVHVWLLISMLNYESNGFFSEVAGAHYLINVSKRKYIPSYY